MMNCIELMVEEHIYMQELEAAVKRVLAGDDEARLDVIANAMGYALLLNRHIDKEDGVVYKYAQKNLAKATLERLDEECEKFEKDATVQAIQQTYLERIRELEAKV